MTKKNTTQILTHQWCRHSYFIHTHAKLSNHKHKHEHEHGIMDIDMDRRIKTYTQKTQHIPTLSLSISSIFSALNVAIFILKPIISINSPQTYCIAFFCFIWIFFLVVRCILAFAIRKVSVVFRIFEIRNITFLEYYEYSWICLIIGFRKYSSEYYSNSNDYFHLNAQMRITNSMPKRT